MEKCKHPNRRRDYYSNGTYKCWDCLKIIIESELERCRRDPLHFIQKYTIIKNT